MHIIIHLCNYPYPFWLKHSSSYWHQRQATQVRYRASVKHGEDFGRVVRKPRSYHRSARDLAFQAQEPRQDCNKRCGFVRQERLGGSNIGAGGGGGGTFNNLHAKTILITRILVSAGGWFTQVQKHFKLDTILK